MQSAAGKYPRTERPVQREIEDIERVKRFRDEGTDGREAEAGIFPEEIRELRRGAQESGREGSTQGCSISLIVQIRVSYDDALHAPGRHSSLGYHESGISIGPDEGGLQGSAESDVSH